MDRDVGSFDGISRGAVVQKILHIPHSGRPHRDLYTGAALRERKQYALYVDLYGDINLDENRHPHHYPESLGMPGERNSGLPPVYPGGW